MREGDDNIEPVARALYTDQMRTRGASEDEIAARSDRYSPVLAAQFQAGLIDDRAIQSPKVPSNASRAWYAWLDERVA